MKSLHRPDLYAWSTFDADADTTDTQPADQEDQS